jgi:hypothetical protein
VETTIAFITLSGAAEKLLRYLWLRRSTPMEKDSYALFSAQGEKSVGKRIVRISIAGAFPFY